MSTLDVVNGGAGVDTLQIAFNHSATPAIALPNVSNVEIIEVQATQNFTLDTKTNAAVTDLKVTKATGTTGLTGSDAQNISVAGAEKAITIDGGNNVVVNDATADIAINVGQTTAAKGTITVTDTKQGTGAIKVDGGTDVTVTLSGVSTGTLDIGQVVGTTADPTGAVVVNSTGAAYVAGTAVPLGAIKVDGGKTISVTQVATSDNSKAAAGKADLSNAAITQSAVTIKAGTATTDVTVKQDAAVAAKAAAFTTGGATTTDSVKFKDLAAGKTVSLGGLTLKATVNMTAAEVAAAFANLDANAPKPATANGDTQSSAAAAKGVFTGSINGWTSGAASGDTVVFTNINPLSVQAAIIDSGDGAATAITSVATGKPHDATPTGGVMGIINGVVDITGAAALKTVSVDGYAAGASANKVQGATNTALDTITLANGGDMAISSAAATLALSATKVNGTVDVAAGTKTLNATVNGSSTDTTTLKSASVTTVNVVAGSGNVAGIAGAGALAAATAINTTGFTGQATFTLDSTATTYTGGAGKDKVTFSNTTAATKAIDLGDGDDTLVLAAGGATTSTVTIKGGAGNDTLSLVTALAANDALSASAAFGAKLDSFERLLISDAGATKTVDLANLGFTNYVTAAGSAGTLTLDKLANDGTVVLTAGNTTGLTVNVKDAGTNLTDVLNLKLSSAGAIDAKLVTVADVETIKLVTEDTDTTLHADALQLKADKATSLSISGNAGLTLTFDSTTTKLATIDGSGITKGVLTVTATGDVATTITGGAGNDVLAASLGAGAKADVLNGGDGNDTLYAGSNGAKLTGGAGNDLFLVTANSATVGSKESNTYSEILDFQAGDLLQLQASNAGGTAAIDVTGFAKLAAVLNENTAQFSDFVNAAIKEAGVGAAVYFNFKGDAYIAIDSAASTDAFVNGEDMVVKLTGINGDNLSWNSDYATVALI